MNIPNKIPINRQEDLYSNYIGICSDGRQFWGYETYVFPSNSDINGEDWKKHRREYVVLHTFNKEGNYIITRYWFAGVTEDVDNQAMENKLEEWVKDLGEVELTDIEVKLFQTSIDGFTFGLIPDKKNGSIELQPSSLISFQEPWDGEYYT